MTIIQLRHLLPKALREEVCPSCKGSRKNDAGESCSRCNGVGKLDQFGDAYRSDECSSCKETAHAETRKHTVHWTDLNGKVHTRTVKAASGQDALNQFQGFQPTGKVNTGGKTGKVKKVTSGEGKQVGKNGMAIATAFRKLSIPTDAQKRAQMDVPGYTSEPKKKPEYKTTKLPETVDQTGWTAAEKEAYRDNLRSRRAARDRENIVRAKNGHPPLKTHNPNPSRPLPGEDTKKEYVSGSAGGGVTKSPSPRIRKSFYDKTKVNAEPARQLSPEEIATYIQKTQKECSSCGSAMAQGSPGAEIATPKAFARKKKKDEAKATKKPAPKPAPKAEDPSKKAERNRKGRERHWRKTGVGDGTIQWMKDTGWL